VRSRRKGDALETIVRVDRPVPPPAAPASLWPQQRSTPSAPALELHNLTRRRRRRLTFETYGPRWDPLTAGAVYDLISWWSASQLAAARSDPAAWTRRRFQPADEIRLHTSNGRIISKRLPRGAPRPSGDVVQDGWDHDHCALCWATISLAEGGEPVAYSDGRDWLCTTCFAKFIASGFGRRLGEAG